MVTPLLIPKMTANTIALGTPSTRVTEISEATMISRPPQNIQSVRNLSSICPTIGIETAAVIPVTVNIRVAVCASSPWSVRMLLK